MGQERTALVVGGGIIGVTSAYALAREGWRVQLAEKNGDVALGTSFGNGRQLSYGYCNALANPRLLRQLPSLLLNRDSAFRLTPRFDVQSAGWIANFIKNCTASAYRRNTLASCALAQQSMHAMQRLLERHPLNFDRQPSGKLIVLQTEQDVEAAQHSQQLRNGCGVQQSLLNWEEAKALEPSLAQMSVDMAGALYSARDETGDCRKFSAALLEILRLDYGVEFLAGLEVLGIGEHSNAARANLSDGSTIEANLIVIANGHHVNRLTAPLGTRLPVEPMKGYSFTAPLGAHAPRISVTDPKRRLVFTNTGEKMLIAGIAEMGKVDTLVDPMRLAAMVRSARCALPDAANYARADPGWAGLRPMTPNSNPIIRMMKPRIAVNVGHGMLGWTLAMGSAERLAEMVHAAT